MINIQVGFQALVSTPGFRQVPVVFEQGSKKVSQLNSEPVPIRFWFQHTLKVPADSGRASRKVSSRSHQVFTALPQVLIRHPSNYYHIPAGL